MSRFFCIFAPVILIEHMHITELKELQKILYFEGDYALFRAVDELGMYRGVINRKGEIVWNDKWRHIMLRVHGYPNIFKTHTDGQKGDIFFDVEKRTFVEPPVFDDSTKSKAQIMAENAPDIPFFKELPDFFGVHSLRYLSDTYLGFTTDARKWGVRDTEGNIILSDRFEDVCPGGKPNHFVVRLDKKHGVIDDKGRWVIPAVYDSMHWRRDYYVAYIKEPRRIRKAGLLDRTGKILVPFEYSFLDPAYTENLISVKKRGKCFFINSKNEKIKLF